jgi:hypothetical protein
MLVSGTHSATRVATAAIKLLFMVISFRPVDFGGARTRCLLRDRRFRFDVLAC